MSSGWRGNRGDDKFDRITYFSLSFPQILADSNHFAYTQKTMSGVIESNETIKIYYSKHTTCENKE